MPKRALYIAAYDVASPSRLRKAHHLAKSFATGGQKSVFECFLTPIERKRFVLEAVDLLDDHEDRFVLLRVEERTNALLYGIALPAADPEFYYVG